MAALNSPMNVLPSKVRPHFFSVTEGHDKRDDREGTGGQGEGGGLSYFGASTAKTNPLAPPRGTCDCCCRPTPFVQV